MRFPQQLEEVFERETSAARAHHLVVGGLIAILIYNLFLYTDYLMVPDVFMKAAFIRLGIVTPLTILVLIGLWRGLSPVLRESIEAAITVCAGASVVYILVISKFPYVAYYHTGLILVVTFGNIVVRLRFWYALAASLLMVAIYILFYPVTPGLPAVIPMINIIVLCSSVIFTLFANYTLERDQRRSYLLSLRERIRRTALAADNTKLTELSHIDPLTGIPNRRELAEYLTRLLQQPRSNLLAIAMFDIDHFKRYNDLYDHPAGDECLRQVAGALRESLRHDGDLVARFGGEEFVAVLPGADLQIVEQIAERMRQAVQDMAIPHATALGYGNITISAGVATASTSGGVDFQALFAAADSALYRAKSGGRNCVWR
jgi:diguanylate cyclase (GGDEF)-like protein